MDTKKQIKTISLTVVRHGQSKANSKGLLQGQSTSPDTLLSALGRSQAQLAGVALKDIYFDHVYASDLGRAFDTASIIISNNLHTSKTYNNKTHNRVQSNKLLRERHLGNFEDKPSNEYFLAAADAGYEEGESLWNYTPDGGESKPDVKKRVEEFLNFLTKTIIRNEKNLEKEDKTKECDILLVSHNGWIIQLVSYFAQYPEANLATVCTKLGDGKSIKNTAASHFYLSIDTDSGDLISVNCTKYGCAQHLATLDTREFA